MKTSRKSTKGRNRTDGRKSLLVYLDEQTIKQLKKAALDVDRHAYEIAEDAIQYWLTTNKIKER
jgi:ATP-dependent protease ClpP protease subunit